MDDDMLLFCGAESPQDMRLGNGTDDIDLGDAHVEADPMEEGEEPEDLDDDDEFKLDGFDSLQMPGNETDEDSSNYEDEDENCNGKSHKSKRTRFAPGNHRSIRRRTITDENDTQPFILEDDTKPLSKDSLRAPGTFGRRDRRKGESLPAYSKRVSHELDSDDELMMRMRDKGFSDRQIADRLAKDGRVRYDQKSISTRIMRIRLAQAENVDFLLKEGYKEWELEDDCLLMQAYALTDIEVNYEIERIRAWRFRKVSEYMRRINKDALFSANACRDRFYELTQGTARIPTELDDDPDSRRAEMEAFRESREQRRNEARVEKEAQEANERKKKQEQKDLNAQKAEEVANRRAQKEAEKFARALKRAAQAQIRHEMAEQNKEAKAQRNAQIKKRKAEMESKKPDKSSKKKFSSNVDLSSRASTLDPIDVPAAAAAAATTTTAAADAAAVANTNNNDYEDAIDPALSLTHPQDISASTPDPRSFLSISDLGKMCADRGFDVYGKNRAQLIQELQDGDDEWSVEELRKMCRSKGLDEDWQMSKRQMKYQLAMEACRGHASFAAGVAAAARGSKATEAETEIGGDDMLFD